MLIIAFSFIWLYPICLNNSCKQPSVQDRIYDEDFYKVKSAGISDTQLYKQAENSIVVNVLVAIFIKMLLE